MKQPFYSVLLVGLLASFNVSGQQATRDSSKMDSLRKDTTRVAENLLLQHQEQALIDSAVRQQLRIELSHAAGDLNKTKQLQEQLYKISLRDSIRKEEQAKRIDEIKKSARAFPVTLNHDTLFFLYTRVGSFGAQERADAVTQRLARLYKDYVFVPDSLRLISTENGYDIMYNGDMAIMSIAQLDALWLNVSTDSLAHTYYATIRLAVTRERKANSLQNWLKRIGLMALIIAGLALFIYIINKLFRRSALFIIRHKGKYLKGFSIRKVRILTPEQMEQFTLTANKIIRIVIIILLIYTSLLLLSTIFTATEKWTDKLINWILTPARAALHGIIDFLPDLFTILVIYFIFRYAIKGIRYFSHEIEKGHIELKSFHREWAQPTFNIIKFLLYAFMLVLIFPYLPGSGSPAFKGISVFLGILISLGSSSAITNMIAGLVITYMRPFRIGDRVKIGDVSGDVIEKTMLVTRIRTIKNEDITVPNSAVLSSSTINYSSNTGPEDKGLILHTTVTIGYDTPWGKMHLTLVEAARRTEYILKAPEPFVLQTSLDDFFVSYQLNAYTKEANKQSIIYSELHRHIQDCCNEAGIEIMSPHYLAMRDGNTTTIPPGGKADA